MSQSTSNSNPQPLPFYSDLSKPQQDLIHKGFCLRHLGSLSIYMNSPTLKFFKSSFKPILLSDQRLNTLSSASFYYSSPNFSFKHWLNNEKSSRSTLELLCNSPIAFKVYFEKYFDKHSGTDFEKIRIQKSVDKANWDLEIIDRNTLGLSSVIQYMDCFGSAFDLKYSVRSKEFQKKAISLWVSKEDLKAVLTLHSNEKKGLKKGILESSLLNSTFKDLQIAAFCKYNFESQLPESSLAAEYQLSKDKIIKARVLSDGRSAMSYKTRVHDKIQIISSGQFNLLDSSNMHLQFSFKIKLNQ